MHRVVLSALFLMGCTQGTTPDCTMVQCGPNLDGTVGEASTMDAPAQETSTDSGVDAPADAPNDAPNEGG